MCLWLRCTQVTQIIFCTIYLSNRKSIFNGQCLCLGVPCEAAGLGADSCQLQSSSRRRRQGSGGSRVEVSGSSRQLPHQLLLSSAENVDLPQEEPNPLQSTQIGHLTDNLLVSSQWTDEVEDGGEMQSCSYAMAGDDLTLADVDSWSASDLPLLPPLFGYRSLTGSRRKRLFLCSFCGTTFDQPNKVKAHERIHTGEKPFECYTCRKSFSEARNLRQHQRIHAEQKLHSCTACGKTFLRLHNLRTYLQKSHHQENIQSSTQ